MPLSSRMETSPQQDFSTVCHCGSVFTDAIIVALTSTASPLLDHGDDDATSRNAASEVSCLQAINPNPEQVQSYIAFCQAIVDSCRERTFTFSTLDPDRSGTPWVHFEKRQNALPRPSFSGSIGPSEDIAHLCPEMTKKSKKELIEGLAENIRQNRVAVMAQLFLQTRPGDQCRGWDAMTIQLFKDATKGFLDDEVE